MESVLPQGWHLVALCHTHHTYIENLLEGIPNRQSYIAFMDDLMLHGLKSQHITL